MGSRSHGEIGVIGFSILRLALPVCAGVALTLAAAPAALSQTLPGPGSPERIAFDAADADHDGKVSKDELARDAAAGFAGLDKDGDGKLTAAELGPHSGGQFEHVDGDGDGVLTFMEVMANKTKGFAAADTDKDDGLTFEEMVLGAQAEEKEFP